MLLQTGGYLWITEAYSLTTNLKSSKGIRLEERIEWNELILKS